MNEPRRTNLLQADIRARSAGAVHVHHDVGVDPIAQMKQGMRWMWSLGDYGELAPMLEPAAEALIEACDAGPGTKLLDVAAGTGNVSLVAARRGARVIASDLTPRMVDLGRTRSEAEGLRVDWVEADVEALPFETGGFDVVTSAFGAMFAPRPKLVAGELVRVAKPGGLVAMANYTEKGFFGRLGEIVAANAPSSALSSPFRWANPATVRHRFGGLASEVHIKLRSSSFEFGSIQQGWESLERSNGPLHAVHQLFPPEAYADTRTRVQELMRELNRANDGRLVIEWTYALVVAKRKGA
jgi:ubiquinone/menaquinone biosynthesis C-methylase UbiE